MWLLVTKTTDGPWHHGVYDNLEVLEAELRRLVSQGDECIVYLLPELNAINTRGTRMIFEMHGGNVDWFIADLRSWGS
jgi:hypothetical protein